MMRDSRTRIHVLLAEDSQDDVELILYSFEKIKLAIDISVVSDGEAALRFLRGEGEYADQRAPDLLLLDINMPRKNGLEVLEEIRADPRLKRLPVVVLTSSAAEADVLKSYELAVNCYIRKPITLAEFAKVVASIEHFWFSVVTLPPPLDGRGE